MKHHKAQRNNFFLYIVGTLLCALSFFAPRVHAQDIAGEYIAEFHSSIEVRQNSSLIVTEEITYDFGELERRGIYRNIPIEYEVENGERSMKISVQSVLRNGESEPFVVSTQGRDVSIRIGDADVTISGEHRYTLTYEVKGALNYFNQFDELYWNVTGNNWEVPIATSSARVALPTAPEEAVRVSCYQGMEGADERCTIAHAGAYVEASATRALLGGEGFTVAVGFPKGIVEEPSALVRDILQILEYLFLLLPLIVLVVMYRIWDAYGRDPKEGTIIPEYEPPKGVKPTMLGVIVDGRVDQRDIVAGLLFLAQQGFVHIRQIEGGFLQKDDFELTLLRPLSELSDSIEKDVLAMLFLETIKKKGTLESITEFFGAKKDEGIEGEAGQTVKLSQLKQNTFAAQALANVRTRVYEELAAHGYFAANPRTVMAKYFVATGTLAVLSVVAGILLGIFAALGGLLSSLIVGVFAFFMPKRTLEGAHIKDTILGFKDFLSTTDRDRLAFHYAPENYRDETHSPEKTPQQFMEYLPFAIALGVEKEWAKQFEGMALAAPSWYSGSSADAFTPALFASQMHSFSESAQSSFAASAPSGGSGSSGGGFSGGGMGGGGGGSW